MRRLRATECHSPRSTFRTVVYIYINFTFNPEIYYYVLTVNIHLELLTYLSLPLFFIRFCISLFLADIILFLLNKPYFFRVVLNL